MVFEVVIKVKAGVRISPGPHFDIAPPSLIPGKCDLVLIYYADLALFLHQISQVNVKAKKRELQPIALSPPP